MSTVSYAPHFEMQSEGKVEKTLGRIRLSGEEAATETKGGG
jgi:hypothetical protein